MQKIERILWGVVLIAIGVVLALNSLGVTDINIFFDGWWTLFIIVPCFIGLFKNSDKTGNIIGIIIGVVLLLCCQGLFSFDMIWKLLIPVILIAIGVGYIFKDTIGTKINSKISKLNENKNGQTEYCATFASQEIKPNGEEFKGTNLSAVFGGVKCDLRNAIIKEDVVINASAIFGGIEIYVPENVNVKIKSTPIFGGVSNKLDRKSDEKLPTIYINGICTFGGIEVK